MQKLVYLLIIGISKLPFGLLYAFSDLIFLLNYYLIGYRRKIIMDNIRHSFPEKTTTEHRAIAKKFHRNFSDYLVESIKALTISPQELRKRMVCDNLDVIQSKIGTSKNTLALSGHVFNYEWFIGISLVVDFDQCYFIYRPLNNKFLNQQIKGLRTKYKTQAISMKNAFKEIHEIPKTGRNIIYFLCDQSPQRHRVKHSLEFLHRETAVFNGYERIAIEEPHHAIYIETTRIKRGYYRSHFIEIFPNDGLIFQEGELVEKFHTLLTATIRKYPDNWLWSHNRWKLKKGIDF